MLSWGMMIRRKEWLMPRVFITTRANVAFNHRLFPLTIELMSRLWMIIIIISYLFLSQHTTTRTEREPQPWCFHSGEVNEVMEETQFKRENIKKINLVRFQNVCISDMFAFCPPSINSILLCLGLLSPYWCAHPELNGNCRSKHTSQSQCFHFSAVVMTHNDKAKGTYVCMNRVFRKMIILQPRAEHRVCVSTKRYIGEKRKRVIPASPGCFLAGWLKAAEDNDTGQRTTNYLWRKKEKQNHHNDPAAWEFEM